MEEGKVTALTLLNLSAAFDTIDHTIRLDRLSTWFSVSGDALKWFTSYLSHRHYTINIHGSLSNQFALTFGVLQGSVLGPLLLILYSSPLSNLPSNSEDISHHLYTNDTQIFNSFNKSTCDKCIKSLQECILSVQDWMGSNRLKLNPD